MPNRPFYPPAWQISALLAGRATLVVTALKVQPADLGVGNKRIVEVADYHTGAPQHGKAYYWRENGCWNSSKRFSLPFAPGDTLICKETYGRDCRGRVIYRVGAEALAKKLQWVSWPAWYSPATMRSRDVRLRLRVTDVAVKRVTELTDAECLRMGIEPAPARLRGWWSADEGQAGTSPLAALGLAWNARYARKPGLAFNDRPWCAVGRVERVRC